MPPSAATKVGCEPIPGYTLRKRLGAGGYGEVWLADAPGGLQKAVKLIYGTADQSHATSELRSLQRIRQVYHPFLLSLERIEIVDNQVVIITELAESSLLDRFEQCRRRGKPGIDRAPLLDFLRDAADALDFLAQKHSLQHLDVKPGNLLIIADRIKVADFGLIKDLHEQNLSLVSGLTPTYSAPELFDGRPDYRSDQYSLAIVYMEMLTGKLPFRGRTTAELARQHLAQSPNLEALPPADRSVVARALAKNPLDRFSTCRSFIEQLLKTRGAVLPAAPLAANKAGGSDTVSPLTSTDQRRTSTATALHNRQELQPAIDVQELGQRWSNPRAMFIGLGGLGCRALGHVRGQANRDCDSRLAADDHAWAAIDTQPAALNALSAEVGEHTLPGHCTFEMPLFRPSQYRDSEPELFRGLSRRWLYNIPRSLTTEGVRPLAILSLLHHYPALRNRLANELRRLIAQQAQDVDCQEPVRIYLLTSLHGGTGSSLLAEIGFLVRRILSELGFRNYRLCGIASAATLSNNHQAANLPSAAALATLSEMSYLMDGGHEVPQLHFADHSLSAAASKPLDWLTLVDGGLHGSNSAAEQAAVEMARVAWLDSQSMWGAALAELRSGVEAQPQSWLRVASAAKLQISSDVTHASLARWCCAQTLQQAAEFMSVDVVGSRTTTTANTASHSTSELSLPQQATDEIARKLLLDVGISPPDNLVVAPDGTYAMDAQPLNSWLRRLCHDPEVVNQQLASDFHIYREAIAKLVSTGVYDWKQLAQIQLTTIEGIVQFYERQSANIALKFTPFEHLLGPTAQVHQAIATYLRRFSEHCILLFQSFRNGGRKWGSCLVDWCDVLAGDPARASVTMPITRPALSARLQLLTARAGAVLESTLHRQALAIVHAPLPTASSEQESHTTDSSSTQELSLPYLLNLSKDVITRLANEMGIQAEEMSGSATKSDTDLPLNQLANFLPSLAQSHGQVYRGVIAPLELLPSCESALEQQRLEKLTTLMPGRPSLAAHVACEAVGLGLPQLVGTLWRPSPATFQLAERLRTRVDIEWDPATRLLDTAGSDVELSSDTPTVLPLQVSLTAAVPAPHESA